MKFQTVAHLLEHVKFKYFKENLTNFYWAKIFLTVSEFVYFNLENVQFYFKSVTLA